MKTLLITITGLLLFACSKPVQRVDYYVKHPDEMKQVLKDCEVEQGAAVDQNCINAKKAKEDLLFSNSMIKNRL